jgi:hypothetical protein
MDVGQSRLPTACCVCDVGSVMVCRENNVAVWVGVCDAARIRGQITLGHAFAIDAQRSFAAVWLSRQSFLLVVLPPCVVRLVRLDASGVP